MSCSPSSSVTYCRAPDTDTPARDAVALPLGPVPDSSTHTGLTPNANTADQQPVTYIAEAPSHGGAQEDASQPVLTTASDSAPLTTTAKPSDPPSDAPASTDLGTPPPLPPSPLETLQAHLQTFARAHGFALVRSSLRRRGADGAPARLNLLCERHGHLRNHRGLTDETRVRRKRETRGCGCPFRIAVTIAGGDVDAEGGDGDVDMDGEGDEGSVDPALTGAGNAPTSASTSANDGEGSATPTSASNHAVPFTSTSTTATPLYTFHTTSPMHNHPPNPPSKPAHWKHRQLTSSEMKAVRQMYVDRKTPSQMLAALREQAPGALYGLKDVQNARAKARAQFLEFLEGGTVSSAGGK